MKISLDHIRIRTDYQEGDIGYLTWMHGQNYNFGIHFEAYVAKTLADFYTGLNPERERYWVAEHNGKIIGHIALKDTDGKAQLRYFLIDSNYRGIGLGHELIARFMDFMREVGYTSSFLLTERNLKTAVHIYSKFGYQFVSQSVTDYGLEELRYEMQLEP